MNKFTHAIAALNTIAAAELGRAANGGTNKTDRPARPHRHLWIRADPTVSLCDARARGEQVEMMCHKCGARKMV